MGADAKRKEARKRKFGADASEMPRTTGYQVEDNRGVADEPFKKKSKQDTATSTNPQASAVENEETCFIPITTNTIAEDQGLAPGKVQRFIVFIGQSSFYLEESWFGF